MALEATCYDVNSSDFVWVHLIAKKLDPASLREWELHHSGEDVQMMDAMKHFLEEGARAVEFFNDFLREDCCEDTSRQRKERSPRES